MRSKIAAALAAPIAAFVLLAVAPSPASAAEAHANGNTFAAGTQPVVTAKKDDVHILTACYLSVSTPVKNGTRVETTARVSCDGLVRRIDLAAALAFNGVVQQPWAVDSTGQGTTFSVTEIQPCRTGQWQAGSQGRVYFLAGTPLVADASAVSSVVNITC